MKQDNFYGVSWDKVEVVIGGAYVGIRMANEKILDDRASSLDSHLIEIIIVLDCYFCRWEVQILKTDIETCTTHYLILSSNNFSVDYYFTFRTSLVVLPR